MISQSLIRITQNNIERTFSDLKREIANYERRQNNIKNNLDRLQSLARINKSDKYSYDFELYFILNDANFKMQADNQRSLREIDCMTGIIAGYLALLLDHCIESYSQRLKMWIKIQLADLVDLQEIRVKEVREFLSFPSAVTTLIPYIIKTRLIDNEFSGRFVTIRNLIRSLSEPSY